MTDLDRRDFLKLAGVAGAALFLPGQPAMRKLGALVDEPAVNEWIYPELENGWENVDLRMVPVMIKRGNMAWWARVSPELVEDGGCDVHDYLAVDAHRSFLDLQAIGGGQPTMPVRERGRYRLEAPPRDQWLEQQPSPFGQVFKPVRAQLVDA